MSLLKPRGVEWVYSVLIGSFVALSGLFFLAANFPR